MAITAKVRNKQIDTGKVLHALVQGEHASGNITFQIIGETELAEDFNSTYFYLLYTRPGDTRPNVLLLTNKQLQDDVISVTFKPTSYFTAQDGTVQIQIMATDTEGLSIDSETGTISGSVIWQTFPGAMFVHASQLTGTETIIEENVLTQYLAGMQDLNTQTEQAAAGAQQAAEDAGDSAEAAAGSASDASRDAASASASATLAGKWAEEAVDTPVETGKYSAKHWAAKAKESADAAAASKEELDDYVEETIKPALDAYEEGLEDDLDSHTADKKDELDTYEGTKKTELNTYTGTKKSELDTYTGTKKTELDTYVNNTEKPALDTYTNAKKAELDTYEAAKEAVLDAYKTAKEGEIDSYVAETSKPAIDDYIEDEKKPEIDAYIEQQAAQYDATAFRDGISALDKRVSNIEESLDVITEIEYPDATYGKGEVPPNKAKYAEIGILKGIGRIGNNLFNISTYPEHTVNGITTTKSGNVISLKGTATASFNEVLVVYDKFISGHKYLIKGYGTGGSASTYLYYFNINGGAFESDSVITYGQNNCVGNLCIRFNSGATVDLSFFVVVSDLTLYFNGSIPTNAQTIADIQKNYPELLEPSDYGTSVVFPTYTVVKSVGVNIFDGQLEEGEYNATTGEKTPSSSYLRNVDLIPVLPNTTYYLKSPLAFSAYYFDINKQKIGTNSPTLTANYQFTTVADAYYMAFAFNKNNYGGLPYKHDIQICLNSYADKTAFHEYMTDTLTLPEPVTLKGAGSVAEEYFPKTGRVTHPIGNKKFSELSNWRRAESSGVYYFIASLPNVKNAESNAFCPTYMLDNVAVFNMHNKTFRTVANELYVRDDTYSDATTFLASMGDETITYALATPSPDTYVDPIPDNRVKTESGGRVEAVTESPVDTRFVMSYVNKISA